MLFHIELRETGSFVMLLIGILLHHLDSRLMLCYYIDNCFVVSSSLLNAALAYLQNSQLCEIKKIEEKRKHRDLVSTSCARVGCSVACLTDYPQLQRAVLPILRWEARTRQPITTRRYYCTFFRGVC